MATNNGLPGSIECFGTPEQRIQMLKLYLDETGNAYGEDASLLTKHVEDGVKFLDDYVEMDKNTNPELKH